MITHNDVWVWAETRSGGLVGVTMELLGKARELANSLNGSVAAVLIGDKVDGLVQELIEYGADTVYVAQDSRLHLYQNSAYTRILADLIQEQKPEIFLLGSTSLGKDLAPRIAARLKTGLTAHCIDLTIEEIEGKKLMVQVVPGWGGGMMIKILCPEKRPQMATVTAGMMERLPRDPNRKGQVIKITPKLEDKDFRAKTVDVVERKVEGILLEAAEVIVSVGWGMNAVGGIEPARKLAQLLGGVVAGTRPAVDKGWMPTDAMIGQSGKTVKPRLFVSLGASGAPHYTTGFLKSKAILAVDNNPQAPIFQACDVGIVGDLKEILPLLEAEIKSVIAAK
jgi:electron transfer flavoprotein alpha subunit